MHLKKITAANSNIENGGKQRNGAVKFSKRNSFADVTNRKDNSSTNNGTSKNRIEVIEPLKVLENAVNNTVIGSIDIDIDPIINEISGINSSIDNVIKDDAQEILSNESPIEFTTTNLELFKTDLEGKIENFAIPAKWLAKSNRHASNVMNSKESANKKLWLKDSPIFVVNAKKPIRRDFFPQRIRNHDQSCFICGFYHGDGDLLKCSACPTRFHLSCAEKNTLGGYTFAFMKRRGAHDGIFCSRHHCTACFADHNRSRCFSGALITCDQCELAWHPDCIPGGCEVNDKSEITCPRHVAFPDHPYLHLQHCAYCQKKPHSDVGLIKCTSCFRTAHFECYREAKIRPVSDTEEERSNATCHWCDMFDFVRYGEYAMARFSRQWWYPCQVMQNKEFPEKNNQLLGTVGYLCVKWLPFKGKVYYNLIPHNRIIAMTDRDYFFVHEARKSDIFEEWEKAQEYMLQNNPLNRLLTKDQRPKVDMSNGEKMIKKIMHNKYSSRELRIERDFIPDKCNCDLKDKDRCGPSSSCINRALRQECPKECAENIAGCQNRRISEGNNCIEVAIDYFPGKGYGAIALENVSSGGFVGEYVGEVISLKMQKERIDRIASKQSNEAQYYIMELDDRRAIDAQYYGNDMRYVNHSCSPNCMIQQIQSNFGVHLVLIANRDIRKGEELSFDYNMQGESRAVPVCRCKAPNCTGILSADKMVKQNKYDWEENKSTAKWAQRVNSQKKAAKGNNSLAFSRSAPAGSIKPHGQNTKRVTGDPMSVPKKIAKKN